MATHGLFTRVEARTPVAAKRSGPGKLPSHMPAESLHQLGLAGVRNMNPDADSPCMLPHGAKRPAVLILGEYPDADDDRLGRPFAGPAGAFLRGRLPDNWEKRTRLDNVLRTFPAEQPTRVQIECFRPTVATDLASSQPAVVLGVGSLVVDWVLGPVRGGIAAVRGRKFAVQIDGHACWFVPTYHPGHVRRLVNDPNKKRERGEVPAEELERVFRADLAFAYKLAKSEEQPAIEDSSQEALWKGITCVEGGDPAVVEAFLRSLEKEKVVAFDYETNMLRPYKRKMKEPKVLSISVGTYNRVISFAVDHPQARWTPTARQRVLKAFERLLRCGNAKAAHNLGFDLEWSMFLYGPAIRRACKWHCTRAQAYVLDERNTGQALGFLCSMRFGLNLKRMSKTTVTTRTFGLAVQEEKEIDRDALEQMPLADVLRYNGLDSKYTHKLHKAQVRDIKEQGLWNVYQLQRRRIPSFANAQRQGLPVDQSRVEAFDKEWSGNLAEVAKKIRADEAVRTYEERYGPFNPESDKQKVVLFRDVLERPEGKRGKGYSCDEESLSAMKDCSIAKAVLRHKQLSKIKGTYIDRMRRDHPNTLVYCDGKLHTFFNLTEAATGRTSSEDPNGQNFPKRKEKRIRSIVYAPSKWMMIAVDHGQLEYRCAGMASGDPVIAQYLWEGQDVHGEWAERIAKAAPHTLEKHGHEKDPLKALRNQVKNGWVFPRFFGSSWSSIGRNMNMDMQLPKCKKLGQEFDRIFKGMVQWQKDQAEFYAKHLYVETLTGRRRRAPMSWNMLINHPIQGFGSDIVIDGMDRLDQWSLELDKPWLSPVLNVHDDLTFLVPKKSVPEAIELICRGMLETARAWKHIISVPLNVEVSVGPNWAELEPEGTYTSDKIIGFPLRKAA